MGIDVTAQSFRREVVESAEPVLLDFWATWCPPCRRFSPVIDEVARERHNLKVCRVNVDEEPELAAAFHIATVPTVAFLQRGKILGMAAGVCPKEELQKLTEV